jgi:translation initiation factor IF-2
VLGTAEVRATFAAPQRCGCWLPCVEAWSNRGQGLDCLRAAVVIHDGVVGSLRRFKDDVREVASGFECGIGFEGYNDVKEGDLIEVYVIREVART